MEIFGIYGASGFGREVMPICKATNVPECTDRRYVFVDDDEELGDTVNRTTRISQREFLEFDAIEKTLAIAIGDVKIRKRIAQAFSKKQIKWGSIAAPSSTVLHDVSIGEGAILCSNTILTSNIKIGVHFHCNLGSYVAHDCVIGDFVTFAPNVMCNGNVIIGDNVYVGTGAIIKNGTRAKPLVIGDGAVIGMGAVVTRDVPADTVVVGNPAKPLPRKTP